MRGGETRTAHAAEPAANLRPLTPGDLEAVVNIDDRRSGSRRQDFYEKRLKAPILKPRGLYREAEVLLETEAIGGGGTSLLPSLRSR